MVQVTDLRLDGVSRRLVVVSLLHLHMDSLRGHGGITESGQLALCNCSYVRTNDGSHAYDLSTGIVGLLGLQVAVSVPTREIGQ